MVESALLSFCRNIPCSPEKLLRTAYGVRNFSSSEMDRLFIKTEMYLKSKAAASASNPNKNVMVPRSRSSDVLPTSQSQVNIQMMSHTLTIREVKLGLLFNCHFLIDVFGVTLSVMVRNLTRGTLPTLSFSFFRYGGLVGLFDRVPGRLA